MGVNQVQLAVEWEDGSIDSVGVYVEPLPFLVE